MQPKLKCKHSHSLRQGLKKSYMNQPYTASQTRREMTQNISRLQIMVSVDYHLRLRRIHIVRNLKQSLDCYTRSTQRRSAPMALLFNCNKYFLQMQLYIHISSHTVVILIFKTHYTAISISDINTFHNNRTCSGSGSERIRINQLHKIPSESKKCN